MEWAVVKTLDRDAEALHRALAVAGDEVRVSLSRETAELVARVVDARVRGQQVLLTRGNAEVTPNEAAVLLGMSRPQVRKLLDQGLLEFRKVGRTIAFGSSRLRRSWVPNVLAVVRRWPTWPMCKMSWA